MQLTIPKTFKGGTPTNFVGRILNGIAQNKIVNEEDLIDYFMDLSFTEKREILWYMLECRNHKGKVHQLVKEDVWNKGGVVSFITTNKEGGRFQFMPDIQLTLVEKIEINYSDWYKIDDLFDNGKQVYQRSIETCMGGWVRLDDVLQQTVDFKEIDFVDCPRANTPSESNPLFKLAVNEGFDDVISFFNEYSEHFNGYLIYWTDLKY